ncbi:MAG: hypothetical protein IJS43_07025, partial [Bacteroidaceae bacterium]|nr:hypothetical protein [Bacteroidaceae bacterium]
MNTQPKSDNALRKALANMAQRQPSPPEGMADRFMARLAEEQSQEKAEQAISQQHGTPRRTLQLALRWTSVAAAAVVVTAVIVWSPLSEDTTSSPQPQPQSQPSVAVSAPRSVGTSSQQATASPVAKAEMVVQSEPPRKARPLAQPSLAQQASPKQVNGVKAVQQPAKVQQNQVKEEMPAPISIPRFVLDNMQGTPATGLIAVHSQNNPSLLKRTEVNQNQITERMPMPIPVSGLVLDNMQGTPATGLIAVHSQNNPSSLKRREVNQNQITERMPMPIPVSGLVLDNMQGTPATGLIAVNSQNNPFTSGRIEVKPTVTAQHDVTANFTLAERRLDARAEQ